MTFSFSSDVEVKQLGNILCQETERISNSPTLFSGFQMFKELSYNLEYCGFLSLLFSRASIKLQMLKNISQSVVEISCLHVKQRHEVSEVAVL